MAPKKGKRQKKIGVLVFDFHLYKKGKKIIGEIVFFHDFTHILLQVCLMIWDTYNNNAANTIDNDFKS